MEVKKNYGMSIGERYIIRSPKSKKNGRMFEILEFIREKGNDPAYSGEDFFLPIGMKVRYLDTNRKGTHYNFNNIELID